MFTFPLFNSFPPEIHSLILESCPKNDRVCLSLASKHLYSLVSKKHLVDLENIDEARLCGWAGFADPDWRKRWEHRRDCHLKSFTEHNKKRVEAGERPLELKKCRTQTQTHCECFIRKMKLHNRLRSWIPSTLKYCRECNMFTRRKKQHKGRCYHGKPKPRKCESNFWTHRSRRGAFGRKLWKKWFNNQAMNKLELRLAKGDYSKRKGTERYEMRRLDAKKINTREIRDNHSLGEWYAEGWRDEVR